MVSKFPIKLVITYTLRIFKNIDINKYDAPVDAFNMCDLLDIFLNMDHESILIKIIRYIFF